MTMGWTLLTRSGRGRRHVLSEAGVHLRPTTAKAKLLGAISLQRRVRRTSNEVGKRPSPPPSFPLWRVRNRRELVHCTPGPIDGPGVRSSLNFHHVRRRYPDDQQ